MLITFIGTGSGKTSLKRFHSSLLINFDEHNLLIDAGDGISRALLKQRVSTDHIDSILISHFHPDHVGGLTSLINQMHLRNREKLLSIYLHKNLLNAFTSLLDISYIFPGKLKFPINIIPFHSDEDISLTDKFKFTSKQNTHLRNKHNIKHVPDSDFVSSSFLIRLDDHNVLYTADIGNERDIYLFENEKIDLLITETTHVRTEAVFKADEVLNPDRTYLVHIDEDEEASIAEYISSEKPTNIFLAYDGLKITF